MRCGPSSAVGVVSDCYHDHAVFDDHRHGRQALPYAGAPDAITVADAKLRAVQCALNQTAVEIEKLIPTPIERGVGVRAQIAVSVDLFMLTYHEQRIRGAVVRIERAALALAEFRESAQHVRSGVSIRHICEGVWCDENCRDSKPLASSFLVTRGRLYAGQGENAKRLNAACCRPVHIYAWCRKRGPLSIFALKARQE